jgi:hypothetical protein
MEKEWMDSEDEIGIDGIDQHPSDTEGDESLEGLEINAAIISDTLKRLCEKSKKQKPADKNAITILDEMGSSAKKFVLDNVMHIAYEDIAKLMGIKPEVLKNSLGEMGIKVPIAGARQWNEINVGEFESIQKCSQCPVQMEHSTFSVGFTNCRKCCEENIGYWIEEGETVNLRFGIEE